jgi:hypothetical protein
MSTQSDQIDDSLNAAQQSLIDAANAGPYTADLQAKLDAATGTLQTAQNNMLLGTQQAILDALSGTSDQLKQLNTEINTYANGVDQVAVTIGKVSSAIGTVVSVIGAVVSAGVI